MNVLILQPPLLQVNTAYPSGAYLSSFFKGQGYKVHWYDLNQLFFHEIFSKEGLRILFEKTEKKAISLSEKFLSQKDEESAFQLRRYLQEKNQWINSIDKIKAILGYGSREEREACHSFVFSPHTPHGMRMERYLERLERSLSVDDARFLASLALADLCDYITLCFDSEFSLVRYGERLTVNESTFEKIEAGLSSPMLTTFLEPVLEKLFSQNPIEEKTLVCISIPFAGTFTPALFTGKFIKEHFNKKAFVSMGGGFVNTELRETRELSLSKYTDALSYDRGYGSYLSLLENQNFLHDNAFPGTPPSLYKLKLFTKDKVSEPKEKDEDYEKKEDLLTCSLTPDFSDIDFSKYLSMADDENPMQRLWTDGTWIKAYLSHGCYWHRCAFCDVTLDYVSSYLPSKTKNLYDSLFLQSREKKVCGIHFVDEALPPAQLSNFCALNIAEGSPLSFWGNIRFEKTFTRDLADFLSYGGLIGVSGGIEIATGKGLSSIDKGTDIDSIVAACCAFKEAGILVHAYMIYGWWEDDELSIINSMETLRQFYEAGILDSSFWHKFVLTRHSKVYSEWEKGMHPSLKPVERKDLPLFAKNALHFAGEEKSEKYGEGLNLALNSWMHGEKLHVPVGKWFKFKTVMPTVPNDYIASSIERYEIKRDKSWKENIRIEKAYWLGGKIILSRWNYMQEEYNASLSKELLELLDFLSPENRNVSQAEKIFSSLSEKEKSLLKTLRGKGLVQVL